MLYIIHITHTTLTGTIKETGSKPNASLTDCRRYVKIKHESLLKENTNVKTEFSVYNKYIDATGEFENGKLKFLKSVPC